MSAQHRWIVHVPVITAATLILILILIAPIAGATTSSTVRVPSVSLLPEALDSAMADSNAAVDAYLQSQVDELACQAQRWRSSGTAPSTISRRSASPTTPADR